MRQIAFNTFLAVVLKKDHLFTLKAPSQLSLSLSSKNLIPMQLMLITHGICWGIPIVSCIVAVRPAAIILPQYM